VAVARALAEHVPDDRDQALELRVRQLHQVIRMRDQPFALGAGVLERLRGLAHARSSTAHAAATRALSDLPRRMMVTSAWSAVSDDVTSGLAGKGTSPRGLRSSHATAFPGSCVLYRYGTG
jgi:hypothetical protein